MLLLDIISFNATLCLISSYNNGVLSEKIIFKSDSNF